MILDLSKKGKWQQILATVGLEEIYNAAKKAGATGGKISGAGGGGFMIFYCPGNCRYKVIETLEKFGGQTKPYQFAKNGLNTWTI